MAATASIRPTWTTKLATRMSGQAPGRIGSSAGAVGSRGMPTSQRGRFARIGGQYGEEAGAQAAFMPTYQAAQAARTGVFAATEKANSFDADAYETQERARRGLMGTSVATPGPAVAPAPAPVAGAGAGVRSTVTAGPRRAGVMVQPRAAPQYLGVPRVGKLDPTRFNMGNSFSNTFSKRNAVVGVS